MALDGRFCGKAVWHVWLRAHLHAAFEITDVFTHGIGEATDVVGKEMFVVRSGENYKRALAEGDDSN